MYRKYVYSGTTWFDIVSADTSELLEIAQLYNLDDDVVRTIANNYGPSSFASNSDCIVISLNLPTPSEPSEKVPLSVSQQKVSFIIGKNFVITSRFSDVKGFKQIKKESKRYTISEGLFPSFFLNLALVFLYQNISNEVLMNIPKKTKFFKEKIGKDYLKNYQKILNEHEDVFEHVWKDGEVMGVTKQSLKAGVSMYVNLMEVITQQHTVCIDCVEEKPSRIRTVLRYFR